MTTLAEQRFGLPDCLFGADSATDTQADLMVDRSGFATNWLAAGTRGVRRTDSTGSLSLLTRKTVDVRVAAYPGSDTCVVYEFATSGGSRRQRWRFTGTGLMEFLINSSTVSTYQVAHWVAGDILVMAWAMEPNPLTIDDTDAVRSECQIWNRTQETYEQHAFVHEVIEAPGSNPNHSFFSENSGVVSYDGARYMCRLSAAFHSSTETYETWIGDQIPSRFTTPDCVFGGKSDDGVLHDFRAEYGRTDWAVVASAGIRVADTGGYLRLYVNKTIEVRCQAYAGSGTHYVYLNSTSGGTNRQNLYFTGTGLLNFLINNASVATYQIANWTAGDVLSISWAMRNGTDSTCAVWNETQGTFEVAAFSHAAMTDPGVDALHAFWSTYAGANGYGGVKYAAKISSSYHSPGSTYRGFVNPERIVWSQYGGRGNPRIRVLGGNCLSISSGDVAAGFASAPNRLPGPRLFQPVTGDFDLRLRVQLVRASGTTVKTADPTFSGGLLVSETEGGAANWLDMSLLWNSNNTACWARTSAIGDGTFLFNTSTLTAGGTLRGAVRLVRVGQAFGFYYRAYAAGVALDDDTGWTLYIIHDRSANPLASTLLVGPGIRTNATALVGAGSMGVFEEAYGFPTNDWKSFALHGEERLESPVPTVSSGLGDDGQLGGPVYAMAAKAAHVSDQLLWSPVLNELVHGPDWRDIDADEDSAWAHDFEGDGLWIYLEHVYRRPVPPGVNRLHVRVHVQTDQTFVGSIEDPVASTTVRVYSMNRPAIPQPSSSPSELERYYVQDEIDSLDGEFEIGGQWLDLGLLRIARDLEGFTYLVIGLHHPESVQQTRIRAFVVDPVLFLEEGPDNPIGLGSIMARYFRTEILNAPPIYPPVHPLVGLQPAKRSRVESVARAQDRFAAQGRRVVLSQSLSGEQQFLVPNIDAENATPDEPRTHPVPTLERLVAATRIDLTPGCFLRLSVLYMPTGETQTSGAAAE